MATIRFIKLQKCHLVIPVQSTHSMFFRLNLIVVLDRELHAQGWEMDCMLKKFQRTCNEAVSDTQMAEY